MAQRKIKSFAEPVEGEDVEAAEPIEFKLGGETFFAYGEVPGAVLLDFVESSKGDDPSETAKAINSYLKNSMDEENYKKFHTVTHDPKKKIKIETLSEVVGHLISERTSRPTEAS